MPRGRVIGSHSRKLTVKSDICRVAQGPVDQPTGQRNCFSDCVAFRGSPRVLEDEDENEDTDGTAGEKRIVNVAIRGFDNEAKNVQRTRAYVHRLYGANIKCKNIVLLNTKMTWYRVDKSKIREDLLDLWVPLGTGPNADQPDKAAEIFLVRSAERSDSLPLQAWHSLARSALSWFISRTSINGGEMSSIKALGRFVLGNREEIYYERKTGNHGGGGNTARPREKEATRAKECTGYPESIRVANKYTETTILLNSSYLSRNETNERSRMAHSSATRQHPTIGPRRRGGVGPIGQVVHLLYVYCAAQGWLRGATVVGLRGETNGQVYKGQGWGMKEDQQNSTCYLTLSSISYFFNAPCIRRHIPRVAIILARNTQRGFDSRAKENRERLRGAYSLDRSLSTKDLQTMAS
ncbi:hypothetical protein G5I_00837 [Acromyrmex echinatior]|uniref:Uncharacterized protein n=1 Tax=Acromyrmex echinatior TaxID=103372 RepID=F4W5Y7_ACREC|nr:hypothetical protein G5I_00837 [Acromyrmex echinatior]